MQPTMCSRCGKNVAIVFITKIENGQTKNEGLCLKCARELHIKPVDDVINKMGISDEDLDGITGDMMNALSGVEDMMDVDNRRLGRFRGRRQDRDLPLPQPPVRRPPDSACAGRRRAE
ncbi:MAG: hypothetical protein V8S72_08220 [Oscillospiraceae bacterium]